MALALGHFEWFAAAGVRLEYLNHSTNYDAGNIDDYCFDGDYGDMFDRVRPHRGQPSPHCLTMAVACL